MTVSWNDTLAQELRSRSGFRKVFLGHSIGLIFEGDLETGKSLLRKYINATVGFIGLGEALGKSSKTLMQMLGPKGNPNIRNFFAIVAYLQALEGLSLTVSAKKIPKEKAKKTLAKMKKTAPPGVTKKAA